ncbi:MAG: MFS transporter [Planctomycetes bacterium]|nr:MFS transporter [Planctomycetota bacterium]NOG55726.1 MFS transporter [Planctomycetota bacterium]
MVTDDTASASPLGPKPGFVTTRLSIMMFLQFFVWGAWYVTVGNYMGAHGMADHIYLAYIVGPIAAIVSPFFLGMIADRFFATERVLGILHILGGLFMFLAPVVATRSDDPRLFIAVLLLHMLCYMPTLGLTNTEAFHHITNQERQFPVIRVFGTIGWIAANWVVSKWLHADKEAVQFFVTGGAGLALGLFSFVLPHTPPPGVGKQVKFTEIIGLDALRKLSSVSFYVFLVSSFLICIPLAAYYSYAPVFADNVGMQDVAFNMSFGQIAEIVFMLAMPLFFMFLGVKWMLLIGMLAWVVRYGLFSAAATDGIIWMVLGGILLHGICYDFFFVTGFIYTDKKSTPEIRGQAQGLLVLVTQGLGLGLGAFLIGKLVNYSKSSEYDTLTEQAGQFRDEYAQLTEQAGGQVTEQAQSLWNQATDALLSTYDWRMIWLIPCVMAAAVMIGFFLFFRDDTKKNPADSADAAA